MSTFNSLPGRALDLASQMGDSLKGVVPHAGKWLETGAKLGVLKSGARVAATVVRRNPAIAIATAAAGGLLWYAAHRRAKRAEQGNGNGEAIEGSAKRVDARRANGSARTTTARKRTTRATRSKSAE